jgi:hypothetical protein
LSTKVAREEQVKSQKLVAKITEIVNTLQIADWDFLLIGDGSGAGWNLGIGWACTLIDRQSWAAKMFYGGINSGTVSLAEILPYLHSLLWFFSQDGPGKDRVRAAQANHRVLRGHVITDSAYVANCGNQVATRQQHAPLWRAMDAFSEQGVTLTYHHWGRKTLSLNILADEVARQARYTIDAAYQHGVDALVKKYPGVSTAASVYDFFLWE